MTTFRLGLSPEGFGISPWLGPTPLPPVWRDDAKIYTYRYTFPFRDLVRVSVVDAIRFQLVVEYRLRDHALGVPNTASIVVRASFAPAPREHVQTLDALFEHVRSFMGERCLDRGPLAIPDVVAELAIAPDQEAVPLEGGPFRDTTLVEGEEVLAHDVAKPKRELPSEMWVTRTYLYVKRADAHVERLPLDALRAAYRDSFGPHTYYLFGRSSAVPVPFPDGSAVRTALDARLPGSSVAIKILPAMPSLAGLITRPVSAFDTLLFWSVSRPDRPFRYMPRRYGVTSTHLYVERRDGTTLEAPLERLTEREGPAHGDARYVFGGLVIVVTYEEGCPVRAALDARLPRQ